MKRSLLLFSVFASFAIAAESPTPPASSQSAVPLFHVGRPATKADIARWAIAIPPDGRGLPPGSGTSAQGAAIFAAKCIACHGPAGEGVKQVNGPRLISQPGDTYSFGVGKGNNEVKTIGSYWPYATTVFDYVRRAMPSNLPGSLTNDEVYALTAFLLAKNKLIADDFAITAESLPKVKMPAQAHFVPDDRLETNRVR